MSLILSDTVCIEGRDISRLALPPSHPESWPSRWRFHYGTEITTDLGEEWFNQLAAAPPAASPGRIVEYALTFLRVNLDEETSADLHMTPEEAQEALECMDSPFAEDDWTFIMRVCLNAMRNTDILDQLRESQGQAIRVEAWLKGFPDPEETQ